MRGVLSVTGWKIGLVCSLLTLGLWTSGFAFFHDIELKTVDARFRLRGVRPVADQVVIAGIDQRSIDALGRWPWPRSDLASLIDSLHELGAKVIALDIVFAEPERNAPENDQRLAEAISRAGNVVLGYYFRTAIDPGGGGPPGGRRESLPAGVAEEEEKRFQEGLASVAASRVPIVRMRGEFEPRDVCVGVEPNIPLISRASKAQGFFSIRPDNDGVVRRIPTVISCRDNYYTSLSLRAAAKGLGDAPITLNLARDGIRSLKIGERRIMVDEGGALRVNFPGPARSFSYFSAIDLIRKRVDREAIRDRIVIVGTTELGIEDIRATPFGPVVPGVEVQAAAVETMLRGIFIQRDNLIILGDILIVLIIGVGLGGLLHRFPGAVHRAEAFLVAAVLFAGWEVFSFGKLGLQYNAFYPGFCLILTYLGVSLYEGLGIETRSRQTRAAFEAYAPPEVVDMIVSSPDKLILGGERRDISVLFSDIEAFTSFSESLAPEEVVRLLNSYLTPMTELIFHYGGTLDKYIGDAIMAIYGAPIHHADHAERACCTALAMMRALDTLKNKAWFDRGWPDIQIRIGISSGPMAVGNMGTDMRFAYTAIGDGVNLASRLEGLNKEYGTRILISEFTRDRLKSVFSVRELDVVRVRGKRIPVRVYELLGEGVPSVEEARFIGDFEAGLKSFRSRRWAEAKERFRACLDERHEDGPARVMLARCDREAREEAGKAREGAAS